MDENDDDPHRLGANNPSLRPPPLSSLSPPLPLPATYRDYSRVAFEDDDCLRGAGGGLCLRPSPSVASLCVGGGGSENFPTKLHRILSCEDLSDVISWLPHGRAWKVHRQDTFASEVIPEYYNHSKYQSFARQVNGWGFKRVGGGPDQTAYYHELFLRGMPHLVKRMRRPTPSTKGGNSSGSGGGGQPKEDPPPPNGDGGRRRSAAAPSCGPHPDFLELSRRRPLPLRNPPGYAYAAEDALAAATSAVAPSLLLTGGGGRAGLGRRDLPKGEGNGRAGGDRVEDGVSDRIAVQLALQHFAAASAVAAAASTVPPPIGLTVLASAFTQQQQERQPKSMPPTRLMIQNFSHDGGGILIPALTGSPRQRPFEPHRHQGHRQWSQLQQGEQLQWPVPLQPSQGQRLGQNLLTQPHAQDSVSSNISSSIDTRQRPSPKFEPSILMARRAKKGRKASNGDTKEKDRKNHQENATDEDGAVKDSTDTKDDQCLYQSMQLQILHCQQKLVGLQQRLMDSMGCDQADLNSSTPSQELPRVDDATSCDAMDMMLHETNQSFDGHVDADAGAASDGESTGELSEQLGLATGILSSPPSPGILPPSPGILSPSPGILSLSPSPPPSLPGGSDREE